MRHANLLLLVVLALTAGFVIERLGIETGGALAQSADLYWALDGNRGTRPGIDFVGTVDPRALEFRVGNERALRLEPGTSPNLVGGFTSNTVAAGVVGATLGGGGAEGLINQIAGHYGTIGGGYDNRVGDPAGNAGSFATVGGGAGNQALAPYSTISGGNENAAGGDSAAVSGGANNRVQAPFATVGGGLGNAVTGDYGVVSGGTGNEVRAEYGAIGGGGAANLGTDSVGNRVTGRYGTVAGGGSNRAGALDTGVSFATVGGGVSNIAAGDYATVGGGYSNTSSAAGSTVGGGFNNSASKGSATVGGGGSNNALNAFAVVGGGLRNTAGGDSAVVAGGELNSADGLNATVGGGLLNTASHFYATVAGGSNNTANNLLATVGGGYNNVASGTNATVPGGLQNVAAGANSLAAGQKAHANHGGSFVWGDGTQVDINSGADNQFVVRAAGGIWFGDVRTDFTPTVSADVFISTTTGAYLSRGGAWTNASDRALKTNFQPVAGQAVLNRLMTIPVQTWNYRSQDNSIRHLGPTAQDFAAAFGLGEDDRHISTVDEEGVALAAIQGLYEIVQAQKGQVETLTAQNDALAARVTALENAHQPGFFQSPGGAGLAQAGVFSAGLILAAWLRQRPKG